MLALSGIIAPQVEGTATALPTFAKAHQGPAAGRANLKMSVCTIFKLLDAAIFILDPGFNSVEAVLLVLKLKDNMYHKLLSHFLLFFLHTIFHTPFI